MATKCSIFKISCWFLKHLAQIILIEVWHSFIFSSFSFSCSFTFTARPYSLSFVHPLLLPPPPCFSLFRLKGDGSNLIQDRKYHFTTYKQCFMGKEFVDWLLTNNEAASRPEAVELGRKMLEVGLFRHGEGVSCSHPLNTCITICIQVIVFVQLWFLTGISCHMLFLPQPSAGGVLRPGDSNTKPNC